MYGPDEINRVIELAERGLNKSQISRQTGVSRATINAWLRGALPHSVTGVSRTRFGLRGCHRCGAPAHDSAALPAADYAYLLGLYLGDGWLIRHRRDVYCLHIALDAQYPQIVLDCWNAMQAVVPTNRVRGFIRRESACAEVTAYSKQWPCLFPQHGPGSKHTRRIALVPWQEEIGDAHPEQLLRGLIQSDGCRSRNVVNGKNYPRYQFCNHSDDIRDIFCRYCDRLGIEWRQMNRWNISVARRPSVAELDRFIGPKR